MTEEGREMDEALAVAGFPSVAAGPFVPAFRRECTGGCAKTKQIKDHRLVVTDPPALDETALRAPAHSE